MVGAVSIFRAASDEPKAPPLRRNLFDFGGKSKEATPELDGQGSADGDALDAVMRPVRASHTQQMPLMSSAVKVRTALALHEGLAKREFQWVEVWCLHAPVHICCCLYVPFSLLVSIKSGTHQSFSVCCNDGVSFLLVTTLHEISGCMKL